MIVENGVLFVEAMLVKIMNLYQTNESCEDILQILCWQYWAALDKRQQITVMEIKISIIIYV